MTRFVFTFALMGAAACGGPTRTAAPGAGSAAAPPSAPDIAAASPTTRADRPGRAVLLGALCQQAAAGRPAVQPVALRRGDWVAEPAELRRAVARREVRQYSVLDRHGARAGVFTAIGAAEGAGGVTAVGAYAGRASCSAGGGGGETPDPACVAAQGRCGVALGLVARAGTAPYDEDPAPAGFAVGGACVADGALWVDIDLDGAAEAFPLASLSGGAPDELAAAPLSARPPGCEPRFSVAGLASGVDLLGVIDADADGRFELVLGVGAASGRRWVIYAASATAARLERVGGAAVTHP